MLQQYLPFTVLKLIQRVLKLFVLLSVATVLTVYGIETQQEKMSSRILLDGCCNSTYRLRY